MGMSLLANLAAYDFGYLSASGVLRRTENTIAAMEALPRHRGHFYNWYDTRSLQPLAPLYVSSVDSGNLAGSLISLSGGLRELAGAPAPSPSAWIGLNDAVRLVSAAAPPSNAELRFAMASIADKLTEPEGASVDAATRIGDVRQLAVDAAALLPPDAGEELRFWMATLIAQCDDHLEDLNGRGGADAWRARIDALALRCDALGAMDFEFLYDGSRDLLTIGYDVTARRRDPGCYDLLASEARLASFVLIARGQLPQEHWFSLGRSLISHNGAFALISWSGSMFEYLMPELLLPSFPGTLLGGTAEAIVSRQIDYGGECAIPWGISESCYAAVDASQVYQYKAFGVPGLGLKRGLADDRVVAPYATMLAFGVASGESCRNLEALVERGALGRYGFYEALDFTPSRLARGGEPVLVRAFMAHHQGMGLAALDNALNDRPMQRRFMADSQMRATEPLLQERIPLFGTTLTTPAVQEGPAPRADAEDAPSSLRIFDDPDAALPQVQLLSNGAYHVMASQAGGGYSRWRDLAVTRWREDATCDGSGTFVYLRDRGLGRAWSSTHQPMRRKPERYEAIFGLARAEFRRREHEIEAYTELCVSPEDDAEIRRVTLTNLSRRSRAIELTSYAEVVLAPQNADLAHRVFSNLFVTTEVLADKQAILCTRRKRTPDETPSFVFHLLILPGEDPADTSFETDRARFLGRGRGPDEPRGVGCRLHALVGNRRRRPGSDRRDPPDGHGGSRHVGCRADRHRRLRDTARGAGADREVPRSPLRGPRVRHGGRPQPGPPATTSGHRGGCASLRATGRVGHPRHRRTPRPGFDHRTQPAGAIAALAIRGVRGPADRARPHFSHRPRRTRRAGSPMPFLLADEGRDRRSGDSDRGFFGIPGRAARPDRGMIQAGLFSELVDKPGGVFVRRAEQIPEEDRVLFQTVARVILVDTEGSLAEQADKRQRVERPPARFVPKSATVAEPIAKLPQRERVFFNGLGGFTVDGHEYAISLEPGSATPAPWANVIASPHIGTVVSERGAAYTWVGNAHEFRLTPWHNDPVSDPTGEAFYIRDESTGSFWSPSPSPAKGRSGYGLPPRIRLHGLRTCRSRDRFRDDDLRRDGRAGEARRRQAAKSVEPAAADFGHRLFRARVGGVAARQFDAHRHRDRSAAGMILARNAYGRAAGDRIIAVDVSEPARTVTGSRSEFIGSNRTLAAPEAMRRVGLSGRTGAGLDPCAAIQTAIEFGPGEEREIVFTLAAAGDVAEARALSERFCTPARARQALEGVWSYWNRTLGAVHVKTPDPALDILANGWLVYQTLSCRVWGRSGYYQSGGAYGFRDQLQDTMALVHADSALAREQLVRCAGRQFLLGDVQHWWHPPAGYGVRTHFSDDYLWLPFAACRYVETTGDTGVLDEHIPFLEGRLVGPDESAYYDQPLLSGKEATLYEHCVRAIDHALRFGEHGLPLMGCGDWNDGMDLVGSKGTGESVWLAWFLYANLRSFAELARGARRRSFRPRV
jgi:cellobiose phosphorylase